jgi:hypothetical protein
VTLCCNLSKKRIVFRGPVKPNHAGRTPDQAAVEHRQHRDDCAVLDATRAVWAMNFVLTYSRSSSVQKSRAHPSVIPEEG